MLPANNVRSRLKRDQIDGSSGNGTIWTSRIRRNLLSLLRGLVTKAREAKVEREKESHLHQKLKRMLTKRTQRHLRTILLLLNP